jgi:ABC-type transport system substrate-binding protein
VRNNLLGDWRIIRLRKYIIIICFFLAFSDAQFNRSEGETGDELKVGYIYKTKINSNPLLNAYEYKIDLSRLVFGEGLFKKNIDGRIEKNLALQSRNINNNKWFIKIHSTAFFHDGSKITPQDVKFTFELYKKFALQAPHLYIARIIKKIEIQVTNEVILDLYDSDYDLESSLGLLPILPEKQYKKWMEYANVNDLPEIPPVGAGYFKFERQIDTRTLRLVVHTNHFKNQAFLKAIEFKFYNSIDLLVDAFIKGEVDLIRVHDRSVLQRIHQIIQMDATNKFGIKRELSSLYYIIFNTDHYLFSKQKIRQALSYTINREQLLDKVLAKDGHIAHNVLDDKSPLYFNSINTYTYDPLKSLDMLKTIGYRKNENDKLVNGQGELKFELLIEEGSYFHEMIARLISIDMGELGINVVPVPVNAYELEQRIAAGRFQAALNYYIYDPSFPDQVIQVFYTKVLNGGAPFVNFSNQQIEQLLKSSELIFHENQIRPIMHRVQYLLNQQAPCIYLFFEDRIFCAIDNRFENFRDKFSENGKFFQKLYPEYDWYVPKEKQKYR